MSTLPPDVLDAAKARGLLADLCADVRAGRVDAIDPGDVDVFVAPLEWVVAGLVLPTPKWLRLVSRLLQRLADHGEIPADVPHAFKIADRDNRRLFEQTKAISRDEIATHGVTLAMQRAQRFAKEHDRHDVSAAFDDVLKEHFRELRLSRARASRGCGPSAPSTRGVCRPGRGPSRERRRHRARTPARSAGDEDEPPDIAQGRR